MQLATYLKRHRLTASAFAIQVGTHKATVGRWAKGLRFPRPAQMEKIDVATSGSVKAQDFVAVYQGGRSGVVGD